MTEPINRKPDTLEALRAIVHGELADMHTMMPGKIVSYNHDKQLADVKPVHLRTYLNESDEEEQHELPVIPDVPVRFPRGGGFTITWPLKAGDPVWLEFAERSIDDYLETDGTQIHDDLDGRRHHLDDAVCYPGGGTAKNASPIASATDLVIGLEDGSGALYVKADGKFHFGTAAAAKALGVADTIDARLSALEVQVTLPHGNGNFGSPTVPPPFSPGAGGASTASTRMFTDA
jgi:hypothetical protein